MKYEYAIAFQYWTVCEAMEWANIDRYWPTARVEVENFGKLLMENPEYHEGILQPCTINPSHGHSIKSVLTYIRELCITIGDERILEAATNDANLWRNTTHQYINMYDVIHFGNCWGYPKVAKEWHAHIGLPGTEIHLADLAETFLNNAPPHPYAARRWLADCIHIITLALGEPAKKKYLRNKEVGACETARKRCHLGAGEGWDDQTHYCWVLIIRDNLINWIHEALNVGDECPAISKAIEVLDANSPPGGRGVVQSTTSWRQKPASRRLSGEISRATTAGNQ